MNLSSALNLINSSFGANAAQTGVISRNISNANTLGYARESAKLVPNAFGGVDVEGVLRQSNSALLAQVLESTSSAASQQALADGLSTLAQTVADSGAAGSVSGAAQNGVSPSAMIANLQAALQTYSVSPTDRAASLAVVDAATSLTRSLNGASAVVGQVREQADSAILSSVTSINSLLAQFSRADQAVVTGLQSGADVSAAQDTRDQVLTSLSKEVGVSTVQNANGSVYVYTDSGVPLYYGKPATVSFVASPALTNGQPGNSVFVNGTPITGATAPMAAHSGSLAGYVELRDTVAPQYEAQLDQIAGGLVSAFSESDQSATPTKPDLPGLFTFPGATSVPPSGGLAGLAAALEINPTVDPAQGGDPQLLRDGGVSNPSDPAYIYNTTGAAGFSTRLQQLANQISTARDFDPSAGLGSSTSLSDYASGSVGWLQAQNQHASNEASYQSAIVSQATMALSNATGVNLDTEMTHLLSLQNDYSTTAKLLTTVNSMFSALISAV